VVGGFLEEVRLPQGIRLIFVGREGNHVVECSWFIDTKRSPISVLITGVVNNFHPNSASTWCALKSTH